MKILIPTDFSKLSKVAVKYAVKMSEKLDAELILLHVVFIDAPPRAAVAIKVKVIEEEMVKNATQHCIQLINEIKSENKGKLNLSYKVIKGFPIEYIIADFVRHNDISLIIMGTKGATGLKKMMLGSNATEVISQSDIPVITVPEFAQFKNLNDIVYATNIVDLNLEVGFLIPFAKLFNSTIHILHIISPSLRDKFDVDEISTTLKKELNYNKITVNISINDDITEGINEYLVDIKADMLAMFTHKHDFFEKLLETSVTRQMAFKSWVPLFTFKVK